MACTEEEEFLGFSLRIFNKSVVSYPGTPKQGSD